MITGAELKRYRLIEKDLKEAKKYFLNAVLGRKSTCF
jgi:hypothetical protein